MDFNRPQISTELVIHTHVPLYFHLLFPCVKCYCLKQMEKATTHCTRRLGNIACSFFLFFFLRRAKEVWSKCDEGGLFFLLLKHFAKLIVNVPHNRKYEGFFFFFVFLKLSMGYVVLELCLVYNIDIVFLKVSIKYWNTISCVSLAWRLTQDTINPYIFYKKKNKMLRPSTVFLLVLGTSFLAYYTSVETSAFKESN